MLTCMARPASSVLAIGVAENSQVRCMAAQLSAAQLKRQALAPIASQLFAP
jgi:hypothetical protein